MNWYAWLFNGTLLLAVLGASFAFGYHTAENKLQPEISALNASLLAIDVIAKENVRTQQEVANVIKLKDDKYRAAIAYYELLRVPKAPNNPSPGQAPQDTTGVDGRPQEQTITGCPSEVESEFLTCTRVRSGMAEFFRRNPFPVEK
jgi:hypothetical protein